MDQGDIHIHTHTHTAVLVRTAVGRYFTVSPFSAADPQCAEKAVSTSGAARLSVNPFISIGSLAVRTPAPQQPVFCILETKNGLRDVCVCERGVWGREPDSDWSTRLQHDTTRTVRQ